MFHPNPHLYIYMGIVLTIPCSIYFREIAWPYIYIHTYIYMYAHLSAYIYIYVWIVVTGTPVGKWQLATAKTSSSKWPILPTYSNQFLKDLFILDLQVSSVFIRYLETRWNRPVRIYVSLNMCIMFMSCSLILEPENWLSGLTFGLA